jgi:hypothetical protein
VEWRGEARRDKARGSQSQQSESGGGRMGLTGLDWTGPWERGASAQGTGPDPEHELTGGGDRF